jgi:8-oxo-dGTP pyrophosphatase MutT (NUDIX family)
MPDLEALQRRAEAEGRRAVVAALIFDDGGRAFVHRRGPDRVFLPGCWDVVGGHVEAGETLRAALSREVHEETGWTLRGEPRLIHVEDWETPGTTGPDRRREFDFIVEVAGDLRRPVLELPKQVEYRWITARETALLDENRGADDGYVRRVVELAFVMRDAPS